MGTHGLWKVHHAVNNRMARLDWEYILAEACKYGLREAAEKLAPPEDAGWRKIDKQIAKLRPIVEEKSGEIVLPSER